MAEHAHHAHGDVHAGGREPVNVDYHERIFANLIRITAWHVVAIFVVLALLALTQT